MFKQLVIILLLTGPVAFGQTLTVKKGSNLSAIKQAIAEAHDGDTIFVEAGHYKEGNILVDKPVSIIGKGLAVIDGESKYEVITITASHVTIMGLKIINSGTASMVDIAGISVKKAEGVRIIKNQLVNTFFGIHLSNSKNCFVEDNTIHANRPDDYNSGNGIHIWKGNRIFIRNNEIKGHRDGIYFEFVMNSLIENNVSEDNLRYGLHFMFSHDDVYKKNAFKNNGAGVAVMFSKNVQMERNRFEENWGPTSFGLLLKEIKDSKVTGNLFLKNTVGIFLEGSSRMDFKNNIFRENGWAVKLQANCDDNDFQHNNFIANTFDVATNGSLVLNKLDYNYWDRYEGYDLDKDGIGDIPFRPVSMYSMVVERIPTAVLLWRSFMVFMLDRAEKVLPAITPENLKDNQPSMRPYDLH